MPYITIDASAFRLDAAVVEKLTSFANGHRSTVRKTAQTWCSLPNNAGWCSQNDTGPSDGNPTGSEDDAVDSVAREDDESRLHAIYRTPLTMDNRSPTMAIDRLDWARYKFLFVVIAADSHGIVVPLIRANLQKLPAAIRRRVVLLVDRTVADDAQLPYNAYVIDFGHLQLRQRTDLLAGIIVLHSGSAQEGQLMTQAQLMSRLGRGGAHSGTGNGTDDGPNDTSNRERRRPTVNNGGSSVERADTFPVTIPLDAYQLFNALPKQPEQADCYGCGDHGDRTSDQKQRDDGNDDHDRHDDGNGHARLGDPNRINSPSASGNPNRIDSPSASGIRSASQNRRGRSPHETGTTRRLPLRTLGQTDLGQSQKPTTPDPTMAGSLPKAKRSYFK